MYQIETEVSQALQADIQDLLDGHNMRDALLVLAQLLIMGLFATYDQGAEGLALRIAEQVIDACGVLLENHAEVAGTH